MERWKKDFIHMLRNGRTPDEAAKYSNNMTIGEAQAERSLDREFEKAWDEASPDDLDMNTTVESRVLTPSILERLLRAQVDDDKIAAYFGIDEDEFMAQVALDDGLKRVHTTARKAGLAELQMAQWEGAMSGKVPMQQWMGKQHLEQADKVDTTNKTKLIVDDVDDTEVARRLLSLLARDEVNGGADHSFALDRMLPIIDLETEEEEDED